MEGKYNNKSLNYKLNSLEKGLNYQIPNTNTLDKRVDKTKNLRQPHQFQKGSIDDIIGFTGVVAFLGGVGCCVYGKYSGNEDYTIIGGLLLIYSLFIGIGIFFDSFPSR